MWKVPLFDLNYDNNERNALIGVIDSKWISLGPKTKEFESNFSSYLGSNVLSTAVSSCTAAIHLSLLASEIAQGDEVIISGLTFVACLNIVKIAGATPIIADSISFNDWNVSVEDIKKKITSRTKAMILVHYAGYPFDVEEIINLARDNEILLIEDVAHAVGAEYKGQKCGTFGDIACFSFFTNKNLSVGEGGMIVTRDVNLDKKLKLMRSHGMSSLSIDRHNSKEISYDVILPGLNYRIDEMRSALGIEQLKKLDSHNSKRKKLVHEYHKQLQNITEITIPWPNLPDYINSSYHIFPIMLAERINRVSVIEYLKSKGIQTSIHYPTFKDFSCYKELKIQETPVINAISDRVLTLPLYSNMTYEQLHYVTNTLKDILAIEKDSLLH